MTTTDPISLAQAKRLAANADTVLPARHAPRRPRDADRGLPAPRRWRSRVPARVGRGRRATGSLLVPRRRPAAPPRGPRRPGQDPDPAGHGPDYAPDLPVETMAAADPLDALRAFVPHRRVEPMEGMPRFTGGAVGALAYDAVILFEPTVPLPDRDPVGVPTAAFIETDLVIVFDHLTHTLSAIASLHTDAPDLEGRYRIAEAAIFEALERTARPSAAELGRDPRGRARRRPAASPAADRDEPRSRRVHPRGRGRQGRDRGRRGDPGRAGPTPVVRPADRPLDRRDARRDRPLPGAPTGEPEPVPVLRPDADVRGRRRLARAAPPGRGRPADDPPDRRHASARRGRPRGRAPRRAAPDATRRSAPST